MILRHEPSHKSNLLCCIIAIVLYSCLCHKSCYSVAAMAIDRPQRPTERTSKASPSKGNYRNTNAGGGTEDPVAKRRRNKNKTGYALRSAGIKVQSKPRKRPPRWEQEGDALYRPIVPAAISDSDCDHPSPPKNLKEAEALLESLAEPSDKPRSEAPSNGRGSGPAKPSTPNSLNSNDTKDTDNDNKPARAPPSSTMWGSLPVGPVLRSRLLQLSFNEPTPIQSAAFPILTMRKNAVLASPCGSGKSLAYLIPLLSSSSRSPCQIMIVTPTIELALQLQQNVNQLWPSRKGSTGASLLHVIGYRDRESRISDDDDSISDNPTNIIPPEDAAIIAGTPRALREFFSTIVRESQDKPEVMALRKLIRSNLKTIVLDEADRLLNTEGVARAALDRENNGANSPYARKPSRMRPKEKLTQTDLLLSEIPCRSLTELQFVCVSATVGRTLRRQLMDLLQVSSIEKAATLVTGEDDERTKKNADKRRTSLMPATLHHRYHLFEPSETEAKLTKDANQKEHLQDETVTAMWQVMQGLEVRAPILVFPGRLGVEYVHRFLTERNCCNVRTFSASTDLWSLSIEKSNAASPNDTHSSSSALEETPIYIIPERFGRGLDLPEVRYVFLLNLPSTTAGYTHMSCRTGRNGKEGTAITFLRPREAPKLVAIAAALGLSFTPVDIEKNAEIHNTISNDYRPHQIDKGDAESESANHKLYSWASLAESTLQRKTIAQLMVYLEYHVSG